MPPDLALADAPADEAAVASLVRDAASQRTPLRIEGNGSKSGMLRPVQAAAVLSTRRLAGITLYAPQELIVSVRAGTPIADLESHLAESGQELVAEPPDLRGVLGIDAPSTIGGMVAANLSGPRRITVGAMRDQVMGIRAVNGRGEVIRSGGRVLKNVTGLDLCKLLSGSHGTLGVLTEVTLKVLPRAERSGSLVLRGLEAGRGVAALSAALGSPFGVSGAAFVPGALPGLSGAGSVTIVRIEDFAPSVEYRLGRLGDVLASFGAAVRIDDDQSRALWAAIRDAAPLSPAPGEAVWRVSVRPSAGPAALAAIEAAGGHGFLDWGGGLVWAAGPPGLHAAVERAALASRGIWTLMRGPDAMRTSVNVVPPEPAALSRITARVKSALDPHGIFNPGRLGL